MPRTNAWIWAATAWSGVIFFSSTSLASKWAENTFRYFSDQLFSQLRNNSESFGIVHLLADKGFHVGLFCILGILLWQATSPSSQRASTGSDPAPPTARGTSADLGVARASVVPRNSSRDWLILLCGAAVGSCSEFLQRFFPDRDPAIRDVFINIGGTALGLGLCHGVTTLFSRWRRHSRIETRA